MTVNRGLLVVGILLAIVGATAVFLMNLVFAPPTDYIIAAVSYTHLTLPTKRIV